MAKETSKPAATSTPAPPSTPAPEPSPPTPPSLTASLNSSLSLLSQAATLLEPRFTTRVLRTIPFVRRKLAKDADSRKDLREVIIVFMGEDAANKQKKQQLLELIELVDSKAPVAPSSMDVDPTTKSSSMEVDAKPSATTNSKPPPYSTEGTIFLSLLLQILLLDTSLLTQGHDLSLSLLSQLQSLSLRSLDQLQARIYFYYFRFVELLATDEKADKEVKRGLEEVRPVLLKAAKTAELRGDEDSQATLINLLLRSYFHYNLYDSADLLISKSNFPEERARNPQLARYLYYKGKIRAVQLNYSEARDHLQQAIRRAPPAKSAPGFLQTAYKLFVIVELLMGEIPERSVFREPVLKKSLSPYFEIVQAVRTGSVSLFTSTLQTHAAHFKSDKTYTLILRLRHNVIKTGLRVISLSYSRIPLREVCEKLKLESEEDAEYVVGKAVRDGVLGDVRVEREKGWMVRGEGAEGDAYITGEPWKMMDERIRFTLKLHNESVKAMRYPMNAHRKELLMSEEVQERQRELQNDILDGEGGAFDDDGPGGDLF